MLEDNKARAFVEALAQSVLQCKDSAIWTGYVNALRLISEVVFTRSSSFVLELVQNAEDAGLERGSGEVTFKVDIGNGRVLISHDGRPFEEKDVLAICQVGSSKRPETGTHGYMGIGFKSVFKVTDRPEVYSGGYQFRFDRTYWPEPRTTPWQIIPLWMDQPSETVAPDQTTFILPLRDDTSRQDVLEAVKALMESMCLFLRWVRTVNVSDEAAGQPRQLRVEGPDESGVISLWHDSRQRRYRLFTKAVRVPDDLKADRLVQEYRNGVVEREVAVAFAIDERGGLTPIDTDVVYSGVSSLTPLGEERTGAKFMPQADFLVLPGREAINAEARWNRWLVDELAGLCTQAIREFVQHPTWMYQYRALFQFVKLTDQDSYKKLFGPHLVDPVEQFMGGVESVPTSGGALARPSEVVLLDESPDATQELLRMGSLDTAQLGSVLGGKPGLKLAHPEMTKEATWGLAQVDRWSLLRNDAFLQERARSVDGPAWFRRLYVWLHKHPRHGPEYTHYRRLTRDLVMYHGYKLVLTHASKLLYGGNVDILDFAERAGELGGMVGKLETSRPVLHPGVLEGASDDEQRTLRGFLTRQTGVQLVSSEKFCTDYILPRILATGPQPLPDDLVPCTVWCRNILRPAVLSGSELWVLCKDGHVRTAKEAFFPCEFMPAQDWEEWRKYVPGLNFISPRYLGGTTDPGEIARWREFFGTGGVKDAPDNGIEVLARNYAEESLKNRFGHENVVGVDPNNYGYDLEVKDVASGVLRVEVKGQSHDQDVEPTARESGAAVKYGDSYFLCVVSDIPGNPTMHWLQNPATRGNWDKLTIPVAVWKPAKWPEREPNRSGHQPS